MTVTNTAAYPSPFVREPRKEPRERKKTREDEEIIFLDENGQLKQPDRERTDEEDEEEYTSASEEDSDDDVTSALTTESGTRRGRQRIVEGEEGEDLSTQGDSPRNFEDDGSGDSVSYMRDEPLVDMNDLEGDVDEDQTKMIDQKEKVDFTFWDVISKIRSDLAKARRNRGLRFHERRYEAEKEEERRKRRLEKLKAKWETTYKTIKSAKINKRKSFLTTVRQTGEIRREKEIMERDRRHAGLTFMLSQFFQRDKESMARKEAEEQHKTKIDKKGEKEREEAANKAHEKAELEMRMEEIAIGQDFVKIMRRSGLCPAVNPMPRGEEEEPMETDKIVTLRPRKGSVLVITNRATSKSSSDPPPHVTYFTIDLLRFRALQEVRGDGLGTTGAVALAQDLQWDSCCLKLQVLDLRGCKIGRVGLEALGETFALIQSRLIVHTLILRNNDLTGRSIAHFGTCLKRGGLPFLTKLDLQNNLLGDHGAAYVASFLLDDAAPRLEALYLQRNEIGDRGALALHKVLVAAVRWCPNLKEVHARQNRVSKVAYKQMTPCPPIFDV